jgi:Uma2 family endonuclease
VYLLIEVSDSSSIQWDRDVKLPLYAREGIQEVWIVDLNAGVIQVCRAPRSGAYTDVHVASRGDAVSPQAFPEMTISVTDLLGP